MTNYTAQATTNETGMHVRAIDIYGLKSVDVISETPRIWNVDLGESVTMTLSDLLDTDAYSLLASYARRSGARLNMKFEASKFGIVKEIKNKKLTLRARGYKVYEKGS